LRWGQVFITFFSGFRLPGGAVRRIVDWCVLNPQPSDDELARIYSGGLFPRQQRRKKLPGRQRNQASPPPGFIFQKSPATAVLAADTCLRSVAAMANFVGHAQADRLGASPGLNIQQPPVEKARQA